MATTAEYLTQLQKDKTTLVTNLVAKGVTATNDETFTSLVPKVANIQGGSVVEFSDASYMFYNKARLDKIDEILPLCNKATMMKSMFCNITNYNTDLDISLLRTSYCTDMSSMFQNSNGSAFYNLDLSNFDTSKVTNMVNMFSGCTIETPNLSSFDTSQVTHMSNMFSNNNFIVTLDLSNFDTSRVSNMNGMFNSCGKLSELNLSSFNTSLTRDVSNMFSGCKLLKEINIGNFDLSKVEYVYSIFYNCSNLTTINNFSNLGQGYSVSYAANYYAYKLDLSYCTLLTEQSLINVLNGLYDIATKGCKTQQVVLGSTNLAKLTSTEGQQALAQAQQFGWNIS